jgi:hypothetical protein
LPGGYLLAATTTRPEEGSTRLQLPRADLAGLLEGVGQGLIGDVALAGGPTAPTLGLGVRPEDLLSGGHQTLLHEALEEGLGVVRRGWDADDELGDLLTAVLDDLLDLLLPTALGAGVGGVVDHPRHEAAVNCRRHGVEHLGSVLEVGCRLQLGLDLADGQLAGMLICLGVHCCLSLIRLVPSASLG